MGQSRIPEFTADEEPEDDWTFKSANTNYMTHGLHPYPARMIPQIAKKLIIRYSDIGTTVWDPFCGSGTALVESMLTGRESIGTDLNPFAIFLSKVKTTPIEPNILRSTARKVVDDVMLLPGGALSNIPDMPNIDYWFKDYVQRDLAAILEVVNSIEHNDLRDFFKLCLASTAREVSNLKKREFKIVRMRKEKLEAFKPEVKPTFGKHIRRCVPLMESFMKQLDQESLVPRIMEVDNREASIDSSSVDLVVTSPPYGDSGTTVAYGQFSRYPALWIGLDLESIKAVDRRGLGGANHRDADLSSLKSKSLVHTYEKVKSNSEKRAMQLVSFFVDLNGSLASMHDKLRQDGRACIVVGNRLMSRIRIPTNVIISELGAELGLKLEVTYARRIPTKRMPWQNAPENIEGKKADTMHSEHIVVLQKN